MAFKRSLAVLLASLQLVLSFGLGTAAAGEVVIQKVQSAAPVQFGPAGVIGSMRLSSPGAFYPGALTPTLSGSGLITNVPQVQDRVSAAVVTALPVSAIPQAAAAALSAPALIQDRAGPVSSTLSQPRLAAPTPVSISAADPQGGPIDIQKTSARVSASLSLPGLAQKAPAESSRGAAEQVFAELRNEKLASSQDGAVSAQNAGTLTTDLRPAAIPLAKAQVSPLSQKASDVPVVQPAAPARTFWQRPAAKWLAGAALVAGLAAAAPILAAHVGLVAAVGSVTLSSLGLPQIFHNFKAGREGTKDVVLAGPLMWFAAASLLALVGIGNGSSIWWNAANLAGVAESATVVGQLGYFKKDKNSLKAAIATVAGVALPIALIASRALLPLSAGLSVAFTAAMVLLAALDAPQIRQNSRIFQAEGRAPQGISPWFKGLLLAGSLMHLFAALMGGDLRWALNAAIAIITSGTVLAQIYLPKTADSLVGPLVRLADRLLPAQPAAAASAAALNAEARAALADLFQGRQYLSYQGSDAAGQLAELRRRAAALPGRSLIYLEAPTSAGKSTLAENLKTVLGERIKVFPVDDYFKSRADVPLGKDGQPDFDRPEALDLERAAADIKALLAGKSVELPRHDPKTETMIVHGGEHLELAADEVLIVDSIYAAHGRLLDAGAGHSTLNVFLYAPAAVRLARRIARDRVQRGISAERNLKAWPHILDDEGRFILPLHSRADLILNLVGADELGHIPDTYAGLLAQEWAAEGKGEALTQLFRDDIASSLAADKESSALAVPLQ
jgi:uridine kinase